MQTVFSCRLCSFRAALSSVPEICDNSIRVRPDVRFLCVDGVWEKHQIEANEGWPPVLGVDSVWESGSLGGVKGKRTTYIVGKIFVEEKTQER